MGGMGKEKDILNQYWNIWYEEDQTTVESKL